MDYDFVQILQNAILNKHISKLPNGGSPNQLDLTGHYVRNIINNICSQCRSYLEIGLYRGGTFTAALHGNQIQAFGIDDFSQNWGPNSSRDEFFDRLADAVGRNDVEIYEGDCWGVPDEKLKTYDVYMFDGPHGYQDQYDALPCFIENMNDEFIYIVDDYDYVKSPEVVRGVQNSIKDLKLTILIDYYFPAGPGFHEGVYFCVLKKS